MVKLRASDVRLAISGNKQKEDVSRSTLLSIGHANTLMRWHCKERNMRRPQSNENENEEMRKTKAMRARQCRYKHTVTDTQNGEEKQIANRTYAKDCIHCKGNSRD